MNRQTTPIIVFVTVLIVFLGFGVFVTYKTQVSEKGDVSEESGSETSAVLSVSGGGDGSEGIPLIATESVGVPIVVNTQPAQQDLAPAQPAAKVQEPVSETVGWPKYQSEHGFSFQIPPGHRVQDSPGPNNDTEGATKTRIVYVYLVDQEGKPIGTPKMVVNVIPDRGQVGFGLWEGARWEHYHTVMHSFNFDSGTLEVLDQF